MRILFLGSSDDTNTWFEGGRKRHEIIAERLESEFGGPITMTTRSFWPNEKLPGLVQGWVQKYEPDLVFINTGSYPFLYRSVPLRAKRLLGRFGPGIGDAGFRLADSRRWAHNRAFRGIRSILQATVGGDTHFTQAEVTERTMECIRIAVRAEGVAVAVKGPIGKNTYALSKRAIARDERKRLEFHATLEALCSQLHVAYDGQTDPIFHNRTYRRSTVGDGLHGNAQRHEYEAERLYRILRKALIDSGHEPAGDSADVSAARACTSHMP